MQDHCILQGDPQYAFRPSGSNDQIKITWCQGIDCQRVLNDEDRSKRSMKNEQTKRRKRGGLELQPFGDYWIEQALRRKYIEAIEELKEDLKRQQEALVVQEEFWTQKAFKNMYKNCSNEETTGR